MSSRVVLDTNTIISALLMRSSLPRQAFDRAFDEGVVLVSEATIAELTEVIQRPKFDRYVGEEARLLFLATFLHDSEIVQVTKAITDCRDANDNKFLEVAVNGKATAIVSGDEDLLVLNPYRAIQIVTPRQFVERQI
ncbi:MAG TPA: putative toxin-antitoxin system toxin component, PIN family [Lacipirellulaceae bacterium]|nr:putative toxin-antitoxin system toxin component, PIN family [Lacipirellulaceae bacterium]